MLFGISSTILNVHPCSLFSLTSPGQLFDGIWVDYSRNSNLDLQVAKPLADLDTLDFACVEGWFSENRLDGTKVSMKAGKRY